MTRACMSAKLTGVLGKVTRSKPGIIRSELTDERYVKDYR